MFGGDLVEWVERSRKAAGLDVALLSPDELMELAIAAAQVVSAAETVVAHAMASLDASGATVDACGHKAPSWLSLRTGMARGRAQRAVKVGRCLRRFGVMDDAVVDGTLSFDHAAVIEHCSNPRVEPGLAAPEVQQHLIDQAREATSFARWRAYVEAFVAELDQDGPGDPNTELAKNRLRIIPDPDGVRLEGRLVDESASVFSLTLTTKTEELFRRFARDHQLEPSIAIPDQATLQALALIEICRQANAVPVGSSRTAAPDVTLVVRADDPDRGVDAVTGVRLQDGTTRTLRCDAAVTAIIVDGLGVPLDVGRTERLATAAQRRALRLRDGGCVFPGCDAPHGWTRAHHVQHYEHGGPTDLANLADLCVFGHHGLVHRSGWRMHATDDGWFYFTTPTGASFWSQRHGRQRAGSTPADDPDWATKVVDPRPPP